MEKEAANFAPVLYNSGARIQLMPSEAYARAEIIGVEESTEMPVKTIEKILSKNFMPDEQLVKTEEIENHLCG